MEPSDMSKPISTLDDDFKVMGEFGPYQCAVILLVGLVVSTASLCDQKFIFIGATPDYR